MCGIAGYVSLNMQRISLIIQDMTDSLKKEVQMIMVIFHMM